MIKRVFVVKLPQFLIVVLVLKEITMRKNHSATIKFQVALAAATGQPITDICQQFEVAASLMALS